MGAQGERIRGELTARIWRATGTASFGGSAWNMVKTGVVWTLFLLHVVQLFHKLLNTFLGIFDVYIFIFYLIDSFDFFFFFF